MQEKTKRVLVVINGVLLYSMQRAIDTWFEYASLREKLVGRRNVVDVRYYAPDIPQAAGFYTALRTNGYTVLLSNEADINEQMSEDASVMCDKADVIVYVGGENWMVDALMLAKSHGSEIEVYCTADKLSTGIRDLADRVIDFSDIREEIWDESKTKRRPPSSQSRRERIESNSASVPAEVVPPAAPTPTVEQIAKLIALNRQVIVQTEGDEIVIRIKLT